jgi:acyl-coenzyme A synthetase/AMP-(fatty) acid ligase
VVPAPGETPNEDQLLDWCKQEMANYKCPREIVFVKELPLNASGKVLKYELRVIAEEMINRR